MVIVRPALEGVVVVVNLLKHMLGRIGVLDYANNDTTLENWAD